MKWSAVLMVVVASLGCGGKRKAAPASSDSDGGGGAGGDVPDESKLTASRLPRATEPVTPAVRQAWKAVTLAPADLPDRAAFGDALDVDGGRILVGAPGAGFSDGVVGSAHVFEKVGGGWKRIAALKAAGNPDGFGGAVALSGDRAAVAAHGGRIHIFERSGKDWKDVATVVAPLEDGRAPYSVSLDLDGDTLVVGVAGVMLGAKRGAGAAVVYGRAADGTWAERATLTASDAQMRADRDEQPNFGWRVRLRGDVLAVGARQAKCASGADMCGAAYLFHRGADGTWSQELALPTHEVAKWTQLGFSLAMDDGGAVAILADGERRGWMLARGAAGWTDTGTIALAPLEKGQRFGNQIAIGGAYAAISEYGVPPSGPPPVLPGTNEIDIEAMGALRGSTGGTIHLFGRTATGWEAHDPLRWPDDVPGSALGSTLAISGTAVIAGAPDASGQRGAVVVFEP